MICFHLEVFWNVMSTDFLMIYETRINIDRHHTSETCAKSRFSYWMIGCKPKEKFAGRTCYSGRKRSINSSNQRGRGWFTVINLHNIVHTFRFENHKGKFYSCIWRHHPIAVQIVFVICASLNRLDDNIPIMELPDRLFVTGAKDFHFGDCRRNMNLNSSCYKNIICCISGVQTQIYCLFDPSYACNLVSKYILSSL